jgi:hypothetical protein
MKSKFLFCSIGALKMSRVTGVITFLTLGNLLTSCTITQNVTPVKEVKYNEICIIKEASVNDDFLQAYARSLTKRGFDVRVLEPIETIKDCPLATTYMAKWSWDLALYLSFAELKVYQNEKLIGVAAYDSSTGSGNLNKFVIAENKIDELVKKLFPKSSM